MERKIALAALGLAVLLAIAGCAPAPRVYLASLRITSAELTNDLAKLRGDGAFTKEKGETVAYLAESLLDYTDRYEAAIQLGQPTVELRKQINLLIRELVAIRIGAERRLGRGT